MQDASLGEINKNLTSDTVIQFPSATQNVFLSIQLEEFILVISNILETFIKKNMKLESSQMRKTGPKR